MTALHRTLVLVVAGGLLATAGAADPEREARIARELQAVVRTGEPVMLTLPTPPAAEPAAEGQETSAPAETAPPENEASNGEEPIPVPDGLAVDEEAPPQAPPPPAETAEEPPAPEQTPEPASPGPRALALYLPPESEPKRGGAVLLHDLGGHPDWPEVVAPLRRQLPRDGWATLAVQMPLPGSGGVAPLLREAVPRVEAAVAELRKRGHKPVVLVGHGTGAAMAAAYLREQAQPPIAAGVVISLGVPGRDGAALDPAAILEGSGLPLLEIHGSEAPSYVLDSVRALDGKRVTRLTTLGTGHGFDGAEAVLVGRVRGWLRGAVEPEEADDRPDAER